MLAARPNGRFGLCIREVEKGENFSEILRYFVLSEIIVIWKLQLFIEELTTLLRCFRPIQHLTGHELTRPRTCERGEGRRKGNIALLRAELIMNAEPIVMRRPFGLFPSSFLRGWRWRLASSGYRVGP